jgi:hypothetical protein
VARGWPALGEGAKSGFETICSVNVAEKSLTRLPREKIFFQKMHTKRQGREGVLTYIFLEHKANRSLEKIEKTVM